MTTIAANGSVHGIVPSAGDFTYVAFGLAIRSDFAIDGLETSSHDGCDVTVRTVVIDHPVLQDLPDGRPHVEAGAAGGPAAILIRWRAVATFRILGDHTIEVEPVAPDAPVALPLLGTVFAVVLHLRSHLVLHGSAASVAGRAMVFLGDKGAGKSTTVTSLVNAGHPLLCDDTAAIAMEGPVGETGRVAFAFDRVKLWDDAARHLAMNDDGAPRLNPTVPKTIHTTGKAIRDGAPLHTLFVLERGEAARIVPCAPSEAVMALLRFSYVARFGDAVLKGPLGGRHLKWCAAVASRYMVARLVVPDRLERLHEAVRLIETCAADEAQSVRTA